MITVILIILLLSYLAYRKVFYSSPNRKENIYNIPDDEQYSGGKPVMIKAIDELKEVPFEEVWIESFDGLRLFGRYYHVRDGAPLQIEFHGYKGTALRDFCGGNKLARSLGQNTLLVDQRSHGRSDGKTICFGIKEKYDCLEWIKYAVKRFGSDVPIVLAGVSMGAATVLMTSDLELPDNVRCIVADCPYSSPEEIIASECKKLRLNSKIAMPFIKIGALVYGRLKLSGSTAEAVKKAKVPILIFHGEDDRFVPCEMSREIKAANPEMVQLETFPDAAHGMSFIIDAPRYRQLTKEFFERCGV